jgi:DNA-binding PadR family transcriptional regulator
MQQQLTLTAGQFVILTIIAHSKSSVAVTEISEAAEKIGVKFTMQSASNIASRLYRDNLVSIKMSAPRRIAGGQARKLYRITNKGAAELKRNGKFFMLLISMKSVETE